VLDNCEHLVETCAELAAALVRGCPGVHLLATSREALHIPGERAWQVPALATPDARSIVQPKQLAQFAAAQLFVERARAVQSTFDVTQHSAPSVAAICARLEGLPLAIELAAAWVRALGVEQILERLDDAFGLLVGGSRTTPGRHQTMRATLDWSYGLLTPREQVVFRRLSVFVGGWSLEAAEEVCSGREVGRQDVLGLLTRLVDTSLVQVDERDSRARYRLLEPVRQYADAQLRASDELDAVRSQHARWYERFAREWERDANVGGPRREVALAALQLERDNLRAVLRWCLDHGEATMGYRICRAKWSLWVVQGSFGEGRGWVSQLAALPGAENEPHLRAVGQTLEATLTFRQGSYARALQLLNDALPVLRPSDDLWPLFVLQTDFGWSLLYLGDYGTAQTHLDEALAVARAAGNRVNEAIALHNLGWLALMQEDLSTASARSEASLATGRDVGDVWAQSIALAALGRVALLQGELLTARQRAEESLALQRRFGERWLLARSLDLLGLVALAEGQYADARSALRECLNLQQELGNREGTAGALESVAALVASQSQPEHAVQLAGAAAGVRDEVRTPLHPMGRSMLDRWLVPARRALGAEATTQAWETGRNMSVEQAHELALAALEPPTTRSDAAHHRPAHRVTGLSPREREVAALVAQGLTNRQIAGRLVVTERTVGAHVEHILDKLGFASRHQVSAWVDEHGLRAS
jgi:predicted ATPase/DNA-binding CsgD family transcriptional regulator